MFTTTTTAVRNRSFIGRLLEKIRFSKWARGVMQLLLVYLVALHLTQAIYYGTAVGRYLDSYMGIADIIYVCLHIPAVAIYYVVHTLADQHYTLWDKRMLSNTRSMHSMKHITWATCAMQVFFQILMTAKYGIPFDLSMGGTTVYAYVSTNVILMVISITWMHRFMRTYPALSEVMSLNTVFEKKQ